MAGFDVDPRRFVRIAGPNGPLGTGFRIGPERVLTGHHVVQGKERFWVLDPDPENPRKWLGSEAAPAGIAWAPEGDARANDALDAAILATEPVKDLGPFTRILSVGLPATSVWESYGYPKGSAETPEDRQQLKGETSHFPAAQGRFSVTVGKGPKFADGWKGISGAPVLARAPAFAGWTLVGVLRKTWESFKEKRIQAIALPALLAQPGFREALALPDARAQCQGLLARARNLLDRDLAEKIVPFQDAWRLSWSRSSDLEALFRLMCEETPTEEVAWTLSQAYCHLKDSEPATAERIWDLTHCVLPASFFLRESPEIPGPWAVQFGVEVMTDLWVEMAVAAREGKPLALTAPQDLERGAPRPIYRLPPPDKAAEAGADPTGEQGARDTVEALASHLGVLSPDSPDAEERALRYIAQLALRKPPGDLSTLLASDQVATFDRLSRDSQEAKRAAILDALNQRLEDWAKANRHFYLTEDRNLPDRIAFFERLGALLPQVWQPIPLGTSSRFVPENKAQNALRDMYRMKFKPSKERP